MAIKLEAQRHGRDFTDDDYEAITRIALNRAELMRRVKDALLAGDTTTALELMCQIFGLEPVQCRIVLNRAELMPRIKDALLAGDKATALKLMYQVFGLEQVQ